MRLISDRKPPRAINRTREVHVEASIVDIQSSCRTTVHVDFKMLGVETRGAVLNRNVAFEDALSQPLHIILREIPTYDFVSVKDIYCTYQSISKSSSDVHIQ